MANMRVDPKEMSALFQRIAQRGFDPLFRGVWASCAFVIEGVGVWRITDSDGLLTVAEGAGEANATFTCSPEVFMRIARGEQNPFTAYLRGMARVAGDADVAQMFIRLFSRRPTS